MLASCLPNEDSDEALAMLSTLIEHGAEVNATSAKKESTALILAAQHGFTHLVRALLQRGADVNRARKDGWTALHVAADGGFTETCTALLEAGASLSQLTTKRCASPLHTAARRGHTAVVDVLLNFKADPYYARKEDGTTALHLAARNGFDGSVRRLIASGLLNEKLTSTRREGVEGTNALMFAALLGRDAVARTLLSAGVDPETLDSRKENALHYAAVGGWPTTLMIIIDHSKSPAGLTQQRNQDGKRPIEIARESGHGGIVALLQKMELDAAAGRRVLLRTNTSVRIDCLPPPLPPPPMASAV
jgi:ankyrin repeat protein